jgi:hypothetical protein
LVNFRKKLSFREGIEGSSPQHNFVKKDVERQRNPVDGKVEELKKLRKPSLGVGDPN